MSCPRRVIAGTSGSPGNLSALRHAEDLARACDAALIAVHTWSPPGRDIAERRNPCMPLRRLWTGDAWQRLWQALAAAGTAPLRFSLRSADDCRRGSPAFPACDR